MKRQESKYYFDRPEVWESMSAARFEREPPVLAAWFDRHHGAVRDVLDVGCGTGAHLERLAEIVGVSGMGIDLNEQMIRYAQASRPSLRFDVQDMRTLGYDGEFDAVACLCTVFCYNTTNDDVVSSLRGFHRALRPGGLAVIDVFNPIAWLQPNSYTSRIEQDHPEAGVRSVSETSVDTVRQLMIETRTMHDAATGEALRADSTEYRLFFPQEMAYFLTTCGFEAAAIHGSFDGPDAPAAGRRLITIARKR